MRLKEIDQVQLRLEEIEQVLAKRNSPDTYYTNVFFTRPTFNTIKCHESPLSVKYSLQIQRLEKLVKSASG